MNRKKNTFKKKADTLIYAAIMIIVRLGALFPRQMIVKLAVPMGKLWWGLDRRHRKIALNNIRRAYAATYNERQVYTVARATFVQLARVALELPSLFQLNKSNLDSYTTFEGLENIAKARKSGKGVLVFTAHLGNWELMALAVTLKFEGKSHILVRPLDFEPVDRVLSQLRKRTGNILLDKIRSARSIGKLLQKKEAVSILMDQNASWYDGVYVPFFGLTACTNKGLALFASRYDAEVLPVFNIRQPDGRYKIMIDAPVKLVRSENISDDIIANTAQFNRIIEKHIRMAPDNWMWVHRRWRLKPVPARVKKKLKHIKELKTL
ncbi:lysophospholipid acyltransferase family protein [Desulfococcaceae bacterium HSG9]|nr:lysophospholipid acyltransferase family protein [Desulfococcaceae bacterium HSG9]